MSTIIGLLVMLALVPVAWWGMLRGWRARGRRDEALPAPAEPAEAADDGAGGVEGVYVSTVRGGQPFERVVAHGLGTRSSVVVVTDPGGVSLHRGGAPSVRIPKEDLVGAHRQRGQVGKFVAGEEGLVVLTWRLGETELDSAVRVRRRAESGPLVERVQALVEVAS